MFGSLNLNSLLSGSHTAFKTRERMPFSEKERELNAVNEHILGSIGIGILRKIRTQALEEKNPIVRHKLLNEAHALSTQMAEVILHLSLADKPIEIDKSFVDKLHTLSETYRDQIAGSGHGNPPQFSIRNLFRATDDMLVRIEETRKSLNMPDHKFNKQELKQILIEFLRGTNDLTINEMEKFFEKGAKIGSILTGGSVYVELVKKVIEKYGDGSVSIDSFVIAVDKDKSKAVFETDKPDTNTQTVILSDDMIDGGGTLLTALRATGERFPNATIHSGKGTDKPGSFKKRSEEKIMTKIGMLYQDFCELQENNENNKAMDMFLKAEKYAKKNNITLQNGWYIRKERLDKRLHLDKKLESTKGELGETIKRLPKEEPTVEDTGEQLIQKVA